MRSRPSSLGIRTGREAGKRKGGGATTAKPRTAPEGESLWTNFGLTSWQAPSGAGMEVPAWPSGRRSGATTEDPARPRAAYPLAEGDPKGALAGVRNGSRATWVDEHRARSPRRGEAEGLGVRLGEARAHGVAPARVGGTTEVGTRRTLLAQAPHAGGREAGVFFSVVFVGREKGRANRRSNCPQQNKKTRSNTT